MRNQIEHKKSEPLPRVNGEEEARMVFRKLICLEWARKLRDVGAVDLHSLATTSITRPPAAARVGVGGAQHAEQRRTTARARRTTTAANTGDSPSPLKSIMRRCNLLGVRFVHLTQPPWKKRDPNSRSTLHHSVGPRGTRLPLSAAILASLAAGSAIAKSRESARDEPR
jgi:hypothetical protein